MLNKLVSISKARVFETDEIPVQKPGRIVEIVNGKPVVSCADGFLLLEDYDITPLLSDKEYPEHIKVGNVFSARPWLT